MLIVFFIPSFSISVPICNYCIMLRSNGTLEVSEFQRVRIVGQYEGGLHHYHHVVLLARVSLTRSHPFSLSFIASGRSSGLNQCKISENLSIPLSTVNSVILKFNKGGEEWTATRSCYPGPSDRTLCRVKRNVENNSCFKAFVIAKNVDVSPRTEVRYLHKQGNYGRAARNK